MTLKHWAVGKSGGGRGWGVVRVPSASGEARGQGPSSRAGLKQARHQGAKYKETLFSVVLAPAPQGVLLRLCALGADLLHTTPSPGLPCLPVPSGDPSGKRALGAVSPPPVWILLERELWERELSPYSDGCLKGSSELLFL